MGESRTTVGQRQEGSCVDQVEFHVASDPKMLKIIRSGISYLCELAGFSTQQQNQTADYKNPLSSLESHVIIEIIE